MGDRLEFYEIIQFSLYLFLFVYQGQQINGYELKNKKDKLRDALSRIFTVVQQKPATEAQKPIDKEIIQEIVQEEIQQDENSKRSGSFPQSTQFHSIQSQYSEKPI